MQETFLQALEVQNRLVGASRLAHWNIEGPEFYQYHLLFERVYEIAGAKTDTLAEQARACGCEIRASIFNSVPEIDWMTPIELVRRISMLSADLKFPLERLRAEAEADSNYGLVNIIEDLLTDCNTIKYLLGSVLENL